MDYLSFDLVRDSIERPRFQLRLFAAFALVALFLSCLGVFAAIQYSVHCRLREIGVRIAIGASTRHLRVEVLHAGAKMVLAGVAIGVGGAWALGRLLEGVLYETSVRDPLTFVVAAVVVTAAGLLAGYLPSRRATRVDPLTILRVE